MYEYKAKILRCLDGDTYEARIDLGLNISTVHKLRLKGIDTPETWRPKSDAEEEHGLRASERVRDLIEGRVVTIHTHKAGKYGRYLVDLYLPTTGGALGKSLKNILLKEGFSKLDSYV